MELVFAVALVTLAYVLARVAAAIAAADHARLRPLYGGVVVALAAPIMLFLAPDGFGLPEEDLRVFLLGSALWVTLAMAFAAFALSRAPNRHRRRA